MSVGTLDLPQNVGYGKVVGRFLLAVADGPDVDREPDGKPAVGKITFTPAPDRLLNVTATPPVTIIPKPIECLIDSQGFLIDPEGAQGVWLIATDDTDLNPSGWTYQVQVALEGATRWSFNLEVPQGQTIDLTTVLPVASTPGNAVVRGESGDSAYEVAVAEGFVGTENDWLASLVGPPGVGVADITVDTTVGTRVMVGGIMVHGDTGVRSLTAPDLQNGFGVFGRLSLTRINSRVSLEGNLVSTDATADQFFTLPTGFRIIGGSYVMGNAFGAGENLTLRVSNGSLETKSRTPRQAIMFSWLTNDPWPTTLPGQPA